MLRIPQNNAMIQEGTFIRGGIDRYNAHVTEMQQYADGVRLSIDRDNAAVAHANDVASAKDNLASMTSTLRTTIGKLAKSVSAHDAAVHQPMDDALAKVGTVAAARPLDCTDVRYAVVEIRYARTDVTYESQNVGIELSALVAAIHGVEKGEQALAALDPAGSLTDADAALSDAADANTSAAAERVTGNAHADEVVQAAEQLSKATCP